MSSYSPVFDGPPSASPRSNSSSSSQRLIGDCLPFREALDRIEKIAAADAPVLITGDTGTGKGVVAKRIHFLSKRSSGPLKVLDCARPQESFIEDDLFGHERGAFTGADTPRQGFIAESVGGTLVLDEINSLTPRAQGQLLQVLQEKKVRRMGSNEEFPVDVRFIAIANIRLESLVANGSFRSDLYYRLRVLCLDLPRLQDRRGDILPLAHHFLGQHPLPCGAVATLTSEAEQALLSHDWPGNVRELESTLISGVTYCSAGLIGPRDLGLPMKEEESGPCCIPYEAAFRQFLEGYFRHTCEAHGQSYSEASRRTGLERSTLKRRLKALNVDLMEQGV